MKESNIFEPTMCQSVGDFKKADDVKHHTSDSFMSRDAKNLPYSFDEVWDSAHVENILVAPLVPDAPGVANAGMKHPEDQQSATCERFTLIFLFLRSPI